MIISEANWNYQKSNTTIYNRLVKNVFRYSGLAYNVTKTTVLSFLTSTLCEYKAIAIMSGLLLFQFALYDFNVSEYGIVNLF